MINLVLVVEAPGTLRANLPGELWQLILLLILSEAIHLAGHKYVQD